MQALDFLTDPETDLPAEAINDTLEALTGELEDKAINITKFLRNMEATADAIKAAEADMAKRRKALESRIKWLRDYLKGNMDACGIQKIESPWFVLAIQKNPEAVEITDEAAIAEQYKEKVITWKIDKLTIKAALKRGETVSGAALVQGDRLVIR